jgi:hypothetical protein
MAAQKTLRASNPKKRARKSPRPKPPTMWRLDEDHRQTILDRDIQKMLRDSPEAWDIVLEKKNQKLVNQIIYRYHLDRVVHKSYRPDVERIVIYSLYNSALTWDKSKGEFPTHAIKCGRECVYWVNLLKSAIWVNSTYGTEAFRFFRMRGEDPGFTFRQFAELRGFSAEKARSILLTARAIRANSLPLGTDSIPGEEKGPAKKSDEFPRNSVPRRNGTKLYNPADLHSKVEMEIDVGRAVERIREIVLRVLDSRSAKIFLQYHGVGTEDGEEVSYAESSRQLDISKARAQHLGEMARKKLAKCSYAGELKEHLNTLAHYSSRLG